MNWLAGMIKPVRIGDRMVGPGHPCYIVAEIGINHNGDLDMAKRLISVAVAAGCDAVKFQKRTVDVVYSAEELRQAARKSVRRHQWRSEIRPRVRLEEYEEIDAYCRAVKIPWFASCWDEGSVDFIEQFNVPCLQDRFGLPDRRQPVAPYASDGKADHSLHRHEHHRRDRSRGRSARHGTISSSCTPRSTYPAYYDELNLRAINTLRATLWRADWLLRSRDRPGLDGRRVALGACCVERHITLDRAMWGSDQAASLEPNGITRLVRDIRLCGAGDGRRCEARHRARSTRSSRSCGASERRRREPGDQIRAIVLDVDGVLTDGGVWWGPDGEEWKRFCFADIMGVSLAVVAGLEFALISGEDSPLVDRYAEKMLHQPRHQRLPRQGRCVARVFPRHRYRAARDLLHGRRHQRFAGDADCGRFLQPLQRVSQSCRMRFRRQELRWQRRRSRAD